MKAVMYEAGQAVVDFTELTHDGDNKTFLSSARRWSAYPGKTPDVRPNVVLSGGRITPAASGSNDVVDVSAINLYLNGADKTGASQVAAVTDLAITRDVAAYLITSITVNAAGSIVAVAGTDSAAGFSETRGADGGPPHIPVDSVEIGQVRTSSTTAAVITEDEIKADPGTHREEFAAFQINYATVTDRIQGYAGVYFPGGLPAIHTGDLPAKVFVSYYTPTFSKLEDVRDFTAPGITGSVTSETFYGRAIADISESLNAGSFEFAPRGLADDFLGKARKMIWILFYLDDLDTSQFIQTLAAVYPGGSYPAEGVTVMTATLTAKAPADIVIA